MTAKEAMKYINCPTCRRRLLVLRQVRSVVCACGARVGAAVIGNDV
jgi:hypothetical protein